MPAWEGFTSRDETALITKKGFAAAEREILYCRRHGVGAVASTDPEYPALLREIPDYPHVLYFMGNLSALSDHCISIVGTRDATPYGQQMCNRLIEGLRILPEKRGAAEALTVAVIANPLPNVTPAQHTAAARDILKRGGALVSELPSTSKQIGAFYLARNRIIAGLSAGCLIVESHDTGGSLYTAHCADSYNRTVMAVPGRATDRASAGTNHLIRNRKAQLVLSADDIVEALMWDLGEDPATLRPQQTELPLLSPAESELLACFRTSDPLSLEALGAISRLDPGELSMRLVELELAGAVRHLPGNRYMKLWN